MDAALAKLLFYVCLGLLYIRYGLPELTPDISTANDIIKDLLDMMEGVRKIIDDERKREEEGMLRRFRRKFTMDNLRPIDTKKGANATMHERVMNVSTNWDDFVRNFNENQKRRGSQVGPWTLSNLRTLECEIRFTLATFATALQNASIYKLLPPIDEDLEELFEKRAEAACCGSTQRFSNIVKHFMEEASNISDTVEEDDDEDDSDEDDGDKDNRDQRQSARGAEQADKDDNDDDDNDDDEEPR